MTDSRTTALENALKALGINPDDDPMHHAKRWISGRDDDRRERDRAVAERDDAVARVTARDMRIADLEATIEGAHKVLNGAGVTWSVGNEATRLPLVKRVALAVEPGAIADPECDALKSRIADLERDLADKTASLKTAHAALTRICEVIDAPAPACPDDAVEAVTRTHDAYARVNTTLNDLSDFMRTVAPDALPPWTGADVLRAVDSIHARADRAEATLAEMVKALDDAGAPAVYTLADDTERLIPDPERIRLLGERVRALRAQLRDASDSPHLSALIEAHETLSALGAPRIAGDTTMSLAARIRAIPR